MSYNAADTNVLEMQRLKILDEINDLILRTANEAQTQPDDVKKYLNYGVGRRLTVMQLSIRKIYELFPPDQDEVLPKETINEVQAYLQAFVINVAGIFDTFAWAFVLRHGLLDKIGGVTGVGMFVRKTQKCLPLSIKTYVTTDPIKSWHKMYIKDFRDALAHRIPLYVPPFRVDTNDVDAYQQLSIRKNELMVARDWIEFESVEAEQERLCKPLPAFMGDLSKPEVYFHPQLNADAATVLEFANKFYEGWHEFVPPPPAQSKDIGELKAVQHE